MKENDFDKERLLDLIGGLLLSFEGVSKSCQMSLKAFYRPLKPFNRH
jgi:hypothetical protein